MTTQYDRYCRITLNGQVLVNLQGNPDQALRCQFRVRTSPALSVPTRAQVRITNMAPGDAAAITKLRDPELTIEAGYAGNMGVIFSGTCPQFRTGRENPVDSYIDIFAADGDLAHTFGVISKSLAKGSRPIDQVNSLIDALSKHGVTRGYIAEQLLQTPRYPRGVVQVGMVKHNLDMLAESYGCRWRIDKGKLNFVNANGYIPGAPFVLNSTTGLIGYPEQTFEGINARSLINPALIVDHLVQINEADIQRAELQIDRGGSVDNPANAFVQGSIASDGTYRIYVLQFTGDTRGTEWYADMEMIAANQAPTGPLPDMARQADLSNRGY